MVGEHAMLLVTGEIMRFGYCPDCQMMSFKARLISRLLLKQLGVLVYFCDSFVLCVISYMELIAGETVSSYGDELLTFNWPVCNGFYKVLRTLGTAAAEKCSWIQHKL